MTDIIERLKQGQQRLAAMVDIGLKSLDVRNFYKVKTALESLDIEEPLEVEETSDHETKINLMIQEVVKRSSEEVLVCLKLLNETIKSFSLDVADYDVELLTKEIQSYTTPVSQSKVPTYSALSDEVRKTILNVFAETLNLGEDQTPDINVVIDVIDRFNVEAPRNVIFRALGAKVVHEEFTGINKALLDKYDNIDIAQYLYQRVVDFNELQNRLNEHEAFDVCTILEFLTQFKKGSNSRFVYMFRQVLKEDVSEGLKSQNVEYGYDEIKKLIETFSDFSTNIVKKLSAVSEYTKKLAATDLNYELIFSDEVLSKEEAFDILSQYRVGLDEICVELQMLKRLFDLFKVNNRNILSLIKTLSSANRVVDDIYKHVSTRVVIEDPESVSTESATFVPVIPREFKFTPEERLKGFNNIHRNAYDAIRDHEGLILRGSISYLQGRLQAYRKLNTEALETVLGIKLKKETDEQFLNLLTHGFNKNNINSSLFLEGGFIDPKHSGTYAFSEIATNATSFTSGLKDLVKESNTVSLDMILRIQEAVDHANEKVTSYDSKQLAEALAGFISPITNMVSVDDALFGPLASKFRQRWFEPYLNRDQAQTSSDILLESEVNYLLESHNVGNYTVRTVVETFGSVKKPLAYRVALKDANSISLKACSTVSGELLKKFVSNCDLLIGYLKDDEFEHSKTVELVKKEVVERMDQLKNLRHYLHRSAELWEKFELQVGIEVLPRITVTLTDFYKNFR